MTMLQKVLIPATSLNVIIIWMVQTKLFSNYDYMLIFPSKNSVCIKKGKRRVHDFLLCSSAWICTHHKNSLSRLSRLIILVNPTLATLHEIYSRGNTSRHVTGT